MIKLGDFRIVTIDENQMSYEQYKETENPKTKEKKFKWVRVGGYYGKLEYLLNSLKEYIIREANDNDTYQSVDEVIAEIERLKTEFVNWKVEVRKDDNVSDNIQEESND